MGDTSKAAREAKQEEKAKLEAIQSRYLPLFGKHVEAIQEADKQPTLARRQAA